MAGFSAPDLVPGGAGERSAASANQATLNPSSLLAFRIVASWTWWSRTWWSRQGVAEARNGRAVARLPVCRRAPVIVTGFVLNGAVFLLQPPLVGSRSLPAPVLVLGDAAVIKLLAALNPFQGDGYRGVGWFRSLVTSGIGNALRYGVNGRLDGVVFVASRAQIGGLNDLMPELLLINAKGKRRSVNLVSASNSQRPNETQMRDLDQVNRRLPSHILEELSARKLTIPPHELGLLLSRLKAAADLNISIGD